MTGILSRSREGNRGNNANCNINKMIGEESKEELLGLTKIYNAQNLSKIIDKKQSFINYKFIEEVALSICLYSPLIAIPFAYLPITFNNVTLVCLSAIALAANTVMGINLLKKYFLPAKSFVAEISEENNSRGFQKLLNLSSDENDYTDEEPTTPRIYDINEENPNSKRENIISSLRRNSSFSETVIHRSLEKRLVFEL
ncbi:hypothetical protein NF27_EY00570 [Candidatus Jidaibacter acanthamoeba]|uniref:Uncharacterized protein n=1 Tax=Candidatus Jidaibacter acanthamoebae TaxID=86105 RepID=A0A0C1MYI7_9RICK|nr:hypothetical protein [Candidatus Jidaibacter acanthamoeba]KIE04961.1 hypothetical protein NF27_EY00570 [Candidatus Jidaibacter acanthamoeba]